jgi:uncharacterized protein YbjT (DUF2867 family)
MNVVIAGGHGQIALLLEKRLASAGHVVRGLIRNPDHVADVEGTGAQAVICDMEAEDDLAPFVEGADAVVFAAGAGPGSGAERKRTVDLGAAVKLIAAAESERVDRYVIVSSMGADDPAGGGEAMQPYLDAKAEADQAVRDSTLDYTIVRPGRLTNDGGTGRVAAAKRLGRRGSVPRADVAAVIACALEEGLAVGRTFELLSGETPIVTALRSL